MSGIDVRPKMPKDALPKLEDITDIDKDKRLLPPITENIFMSIFEDFLILVTGFNKQVINSSSREFQHDAKSVLDEIQEYIQFTHTKIQMLAWNFDQAAAKAASTNMMAYKKLARYAHQDSNRCHRCQPRQLPLQADSHLSSHHCS